MAPRKPRYMRVIYFDRDGRTANVSTAIITDDTDVNRRTVELQQTGRNVNVQTTEPVRDPQLVPSLDAVLAQLPAGYTRDPNLSW
jgi:hypothetical protein